MPDKQELRSCLRDTREKLEPEYVKNSDLSIYNKLISLPEYVSAENIFCYYSIDGEADTHAIISHALKAGKRVYLPVVYDGGLMEAVEVSDVFRLIPGKLNIPEPPRDGRVLVPGTEDIAIVPGLAFDRDGYRLGQGGGYYDRFLKTWPGVSVGLCRRKFLLNELPIECHDMKVDKVVTEARG